MTTYSEYLDQIAKLQSLAEQARQVEITEARRQILQLMQKHNLQFDDLVAKEKTAPSKRKGKSISAKYRDPDSGSTWSGRGRAPRWLGGRNKSDFLIKE